MLNGSRRVAWVFPGFSVGGAQVRFAALANHFGERLRHTVISLNGDLACAEKLAPGHCVQFLSPPHQRGHMASSILHARQILRAQKTDVVVTSNWGSIEWAAGAKLAGLPHLHTEDGFGPEERARQLPRRVWMRRIVLRRSRVILPSHTLHGLARNVWALPAKNLFYVANGIDLARFSGAVPAPEPPGEGPLIGTIAALRPEKALSRLVRAFASLRRDRAARLVIVGDGPEKPALHNLAGSLGIAGDTHFPGHTTRPEEWLARFDVFALSSDTEQMPISLLEAMASGLPAVCTDVGDVRKMLAPENHDFVTGLNEAAFADGLARLLAAPLAAIGGANRARAAAEFEEKKMFSAYAELLGL
jgi:glycosyltransferase involved in cell wall biosynthesis